VRVLPGVTYLDLILRIASEEFQTHQIHLSNILFYEPLTTSDLYDQRVEVIFDLDQSESFWRVQVRSQKFKDVILSEWAKNVECSLYLNKEEFQAPSIDIAALKASSIEQFSMEEGVYSTARKHDIVHEEFMKSIGTVFRGEHEVLMELQLSPLAQRYLNDFYLHAAFLDAATFACGGFSSDPTTHDPYIPFYIQKFCAKGPLPEICYVYSKVTGTNKTNKDVVKCDVSIHNASGVALVTFGGLTIKHIRSKELITKLTKVSL
jgi:hypothetical protein